MKVVRLSALRTGWLYPHEIFLILISVKRLSRPQGHNTAGRVMPMNRVWHWIIMGRSLERNLVVSLHLISRLRVVFDGVLRRNINVFQTELFLQELNWLLMKGLLVQSLNFQELSTWVSEGSTFIQVILRSLPKVFLNGLRTLRP